MGEKGEQRKRRRDIEARKTKTEALAAIRKAREALEILEEHREEIEADPKLCSRADQFVREIERLGRLLFEAYEKNEARRKRFKVVK